MAPYFAVDGLTDEIIGAGCPVPVTLMLSMNHPRNPLNSRSPVSKLKRTITVSPTYGVRLKICWVQTPLLPSPPELYGFQLSP